MIIEYDLKLVSITSSILINSDSVLSNKICQIQNGCNGDWKYYICAPTACWN